MQVFEIRLVSLHFLFINFSVNHLYNLHFISYIAAQKFYIHKNSQHEKDSYITLLLDDRFHGISRQLDRNMGYCTRMDRSG